MVEEQLIYLDGWVFAVELVSHEPANLQHASNRQGWLASGDFLLHFGGGGGREGHVDVHAISLSDLRPLDFSGIIINVSRPITASSPSPA